VPGGSGARVFLLELKRDAGHFRLRLGQADSRQKTRKNDDGVVVSPGGRALQNERHPEVIGTARAKQVEFRRKNANHCEGLAVNRNRGSNYAGILTKAPLPEAVAQDHHGVAAWLFLPSSIDASPDAGAGKKAPAEAKSKPSMTTSSRTKKKSSSSSRRKRRTSFKSRLAQLKLQPERVLEIQRSLIEVGYLRQEPTGKWDAATRGAMLRFQTDHGFPATGLPEAKSLMKLGLGPHPLPLDLDPTAQARARADAPEAPAADFSEEEDSEVSPP